MVEPPSLLMDIRKEIVISPKGGKPVSIQSHFIQPVLKLTDKTPNLPSIFIPFKPILPKCTFNGWRNPTDQWVSWVNRLHSTYKNTWKRAGIYGAILSSKYQVIKNEELVLGLVERWCCETNTFVFSWGEATITLEDMLVLGGFSVLGNSVCGYNNDKQVNEVEEQLLAVYDKLDSGLSSEVDQSAWMKRFMGKNSEFEHEAFLSLWLSRFVLPMYPFNSIVPKCFKIAVCLAKGIEIAMAPFVLASIYKDLSLLKSVIENVGKVDVLGDDLLMVTTWAPLQWVQIWAWERFPQFRPKPNGVKTGEPRIARWHGVNDEEIGNVRALLQSAADSFEWRPYCKVVDMLPLQTVFKKEEQFVFMENVGKEVKVMAHCLRVSELPGLESIEQYNPHRVAMQFGFDQDLPHIVQRNLINFGIPMKDLEQLAWLTYVDPIKDPMLYIPSMSYEPRVTLRYLKWLRDGKLTRQAALKCIVTRKRDSVRLRRLQTPRLLFANDEEDPPPKIKARNNIAPEIDVRPNFETNWGVNDLDVPPCFTPNLNVSKLKKTVGHAIDVPPGFLSNSISMDLDVPPGFTPNSNVTKNKADVVHDVNVLPGFTPNSNVAKNKADVVHDVNVLPGFTPNSNVAKNKAAVVHDANVPPGFTPNSNVAKNKADVVHDANVLPGFTPNSNVAKNKAAVVHDTNVPPGFTPNSIITKKNVDVAHDSKLKKNVGHALDKLPGLVPKSIGNDLDAPPGFQPNTNVAKNKMDGPHDSKSKKIVGHARDVPPAFVANSIGDGLDDVPPGFKRKYVEPMKLDAATKHVSALEPLVKVKKEPIQTIGDVQESIRSGYQTALSLPGNIIGRNEKKSSNVDGKSSGKSTQDGGDIACVVTHGSKRLDVTACISELRKKIAALKEST